MNKEKEMNKEKGNRQQKKRIKNDDFCQQVKNFIYYYIKDDIYEIPIFELINLYNKSFIWKLKYPIYKLIYNLTYGREN